MNKNISIKLNPYLGCSNNLIDLFAVIGYDEKILLDNSPNILQNDNIKLSVISQIKSNFLKSKVCFDIIINQIYPEKPKIIKILKSVKKPKESNVIFSSCFDSLDGQDKIFYSCYALRFYEKYIDKNSKEEYYLPKSFLIYSQYPYFSTFKSICNTLLEYIYKEIIPIEILIHCLVNYVPSPINNKLYIKDFGTNIIKIPKLTGYPYIDFDLCKIINSIKINEFIKIYILIFIEIDLLFFSPNLEKLNILMFALYILNYPLTDSMYFWHINSISKDELSEDNGTLSTCYKGVNINYNSNINLSDYKRSLYFIVDLENKKKYIHCIKKDKLY